MGLHVIRPADVDSVGVLAIHRRRYSYIFKPNVLAVVNYYVKEFTILWSYPFNISIGHLIQFDILFKSTKSIIN